MGSVVTGANGKTRPEKLEKFRLTSSSRALLEKVAELYGGAVQAWTPQGNGAPAWEVFTDSARLPVLVPPQPVSQYYELWSGGGCQRRCDGVTELLTDSPCPCGPDPDERKCKPTTRLNVILRDVEGIGVWRLESHGWYSAVELPDVADFLAQSRGYVEAHLALEERVVTRDGKTKRFMVPTLEVGVTPAQLMAGTGVTAIGGPVPRELSVAAPRALPAADVLQDRDSIRDALIHVADHGGLDDLRALWNDARGVGLEDMALGIAEDMKRIQAANRQDTASRAESKRVANSTAGGKSVDELWLQIMQNVPEDWATSRVEQEFEGVTKVPADKATAEDMQRYLEHLASVTA